VQEVPNFTISPGLTAEQNRTEDPVTTLVAVNVTMWSMLVGTPWPVPARGALAVIEDVGEKPYRLDRHLTHLELAGELGQVAAMIVGDLTRCDDASPTAEHSDHSGTAAAVVLDRLRVVSPDRHCDAPHRWATAT
jgi:muramoyltetrapeptide carboxypeptidase LdcA involved in peptidoglycan recycling